MAMVVNGQISFTDEIMAVSSTAFSSPECVVPVDVDGDGDLDLVVSADSGAIKVGVLKNVDGHGKFGPVENVASAGFATTSIVAADIDGDGDMDLGAVSLFENKVSWLNNTDGLGTYERIVVSGLVNDPRAVVAADIDGDGDVDLVSASFGDAKVAWYPNLGGGVFGEQIVVATGVTGASSVVAADFDGDGDLDLLYAGKDADLCWWVANDGSGGFGGVMGATASGVDGPVSVAAGDFNKDGRIDFAVALNEGNKVVWFPNTGLSGARRFGAENVLTSSAPGASSVYATDLDLDGDLDVLYTSTTDDTVGMFLNQGSGTFGAKVVLSSSSTFATFVAAGDLSGDGLPDVVSVSRAFFEVVWYVGTVEDTSFEAQSVIDTGYGQVRRVFPADMNGDGLLDVLVTFTTGAGWYRNFGGSSFSSSIKPVFPSGSYVIQSAMPADVDGDGDLDVLVTGSELDAVYWYPNTGIGNFGSQEVVTTATDNPRLAIGANFTGGRCDSVVSISLGDDRLAWYNNSNCLGTFGTQVVIPHGMSTMSGLWAADFDSDGDMDFAVSSTLGDRLVVVNNTDGKGTFAVGYIGLSGSATSIMAADIDGDGILDLAGAGAASIGNGVYRLFWFRGFGDGTFGPLIPVSMAPWSARSVWAGDLDGDGDVDLATASVQDNKIAWYENRDGAGSFGPQLVVTPSATGTTSEAYGVCAIDVDSDGDLDLISGSRIDQKVALYVKGSPPPPPPSMAPPPSPSPPSSGTSSPPPPTTSSAFSPPPPPPLSSSSSGTNQIGSSSSSDEEGSNTGVIVGGVVGGVFLLGVVAALVVFLVARKSSGGKTPPASDPGVDLAAV